MWFFTLAIVTVLFILKKQLIEKNEIPKIIHQTAPADEKKWDPIWKPCQESWKRNFPKWQYKMWTDEDLDEFMRTKYSWFYPTYISYPQNIMRFDAARYFILYEYGGIYADMDFECVKNFEHLLPSGFTFAAETPWGTWGEVYQNALMGSPKNHEFWKFVFVDLLMNKNDSSVLHATGPEVIHRVANDHPELFYPFESKKFAPKIPKELDAPNHNFASLSIKERTNLTMKRFNTKPGEDVYTRHHGSCAWCRNKE